MGCQPKISATLFQALLRWGKHCARSENYNWTKWDANDYAFIQQAVKRLASEKYYSNKKKNMTQKMKQSAMERAKLICTPPPECINFKDTKKLTLYHGTNFKFLDKIKYHGIIPRGNKKSNWENCPSHPELVYLSNCYACYYANASCNNKGDRPMILKIELVPATVPLFADEEFIFHRFRMELDEELEGIDMAKFYTTLDPRKLPDFRWQHSLSFMGTVSAEHIPVNCIKEYYVAKKGDMEFYTNCDPSVSPLNYNIMGRAYMDYLHNLPFKKL